MSQEDIYDWLARQRLMGFDEYFTINELCNGLKSLNSNYRRGNISPQLNKLRVYGYLDCYIGKRNQIHFRIKRKYAFKEKKRLINEIEVV